jgi:hypothetical protein
MEVGVVRLIFCGFMVGVLSGCAAVSGTSGERVMKISIFTPVNARIKGTLNNI